MEKEKSDSEINELTEQEENSETQEHGGPKGLEPTRYGDWEKGGRCVDF
ncbi:MAG: hypothetical protein COV35_05755 [Alphaproteobacteria bacterium CG11_big_fil_rev_8_21_14_0_20_39_49]|nr:MAG: hypothetical protein COV35_05755 [Alphaproteobacteria bacterium CG11_big_fil_rev_8_21_14_0_20_39_49]